MRTALLILLISVPAAAKKPWLEDPAYAPQTVEIFGVVHTTNPVSATDIAISTTLTAIKNRADLLATEATLATRASEATLALVKTKTDNQGHLTTYAYNARGLEISRTEAAGTPQARSISTEWHPSFFLPLVVTEPGRVTRYQYDEQEIGRAHV